MTDLSYDGLSLHWEYSGSDDSLDGFKIAWTQTFEDDEPVFGTWWVAAPRLARDFEPYIQPCSPANRTAFSVWAWNASGDGSADTCEGKPPESLPTLDLHIDSENDGAIGGTYPVYGPEGEVDEAMETAAPGKIIPLADPSAYSAGTPFRLEGNNLDDSDIVTFDFDDKALAIALPPDANNKIGWLSSNEELTWGELHALFNAHAENSYYGELILHVWGLEGGADDLGQRGRWRGRPRDARRRCDRTLGPGPEPHGLPHRRKLGRGRR